MDQHQHSIEQLSCFYNKVTEQLFRAAGLTTLIAFVITFVAPWPALAAIEAAASGEILEFSRDEILKQSSIIVLVSLDSENKVAHMVIPDDLIVDASLGIGSVVTVMATAYSSSIGQTDLSPTVTASGRETGSGTVAANFLPFGTKVKIGQNIYTVWDRMNSRYDGKYIIDVWYASLEEARHHGVRQMTMEIVELPVTSNR